MSEYTLQDNQTVLDVLAVTGLVVSRSEGRRMIDHKSVKLDGGSIGEISTRPSASGSAAGGEAALCARKIKKSPGTFKAPGNFSVLWLDGRSSNCWPSSGPLVVGILQQNQHPPWACPANQEASCQRPGDGFISLPGQSAPLPEMAGFPA